jgi:hypothetical protein
MERSAIRGSNRGVSPGLRHSRCEASAFLRTAAGRPPMSSGLRIHPPRSRRPPPSTMSARPGQFSLKLNPAPGLAGSSVGFGVAAGVRLTALSRPRQMGCVARKSRPARTNDAPSKMIVIRASCLLGGETSSKSSRSYYFNVAGGNFVPTILRPPAQEAPFRTLPPARSARSSSPDWQAWPKCRHAPAARPCRSSRPRRR